MKKKCNFTLTTSHFIFTFLYTHLKETATIYSNQKFVKSQVLHVRPFFREYIGQIGKVLLVINLGDRYVLRYVPT